jgi:hypothetical protein
MTVGPLVVGIGLLLMRRIGVGGSYWADVFPPIVVFGLGLSLTVAPLTATVLAAVDERHAGVASGVNNAVARAASLLTVAVLPSLSGITGDSYRHPAAFSTGFHKSCMITAGLCGAGAVIAWFGIRSSEEGAAQPRPAEVLHNSFCPVDGPPFRRHPAA